MFVERGYPGTTLTDVAAAAGVAHARCTCASVARPSCWGGSSTRRWWATPNPSTCSAAAGCRPRSPRRRPPSGWSRTPRRAGRSSNGPGRCSRWRSRPRPSSR
ncbi:hypothetical protein I4I73_30245 [Pseudonocardia sp. KRD-184]|uniref:HTH tetR-type domain-containing protein n=1 Tax=Pseudonocardia oceani TaxID=2792013 RepID=A0ABS6U3V8_9PSEU|nr:hypothetical protein [Pseudonocardia oceani]MBW0100267.1 hypothetical protein [Pseudonocardia oceani]MBW0125844.1 hypothetical protein [Pseudonocardia oceani]MBW0126920.1 hypothetical protein [Pseudonocardia oceani]